MVATSINCISVIRKPLLLFAPACLLLVGCASQAKFGGQDWDVNLVAVSDKDPMETSLHVPAYLIPERVYLNNPDIADRTSLQKDPSPLKPYLRGVTPVKVHIKLRWVYVAGSTTDGFSDALDFTPSDLEDMPPNSDQLVEKIAKAELRK